MDEENNELINKIFFSKYKIEKKLGEGSYGQVYKAINISNNEAVAIKLEKKIANQNFLEIEANTISTLKSIGIPNLKSFGKSGNYNVLVLELLDRSLDSLFDCCEQKFSLKTVCMLAIQIIDRIEFLHSKTLIHRDIKPDNFVMGLGENSNILYLIDFGLTKKYKTSNVVKENRYVVGTAIFASVNALRGQEQSRKDDLEAIGYVLIYLMRGRLPWQCIDSEKVKDRNKKILELKKSTSINELVEGLPDEFRMYMQYIKDLSFDDNPNYDQLRNLFKNMMEKNNLEFDLNWDWLYFEQKQKEKFESSVEEIIDYKPIEYLENKNEDDKNFHEISQLENYNYIEETNKLNQQENTMQNLSDEIEMENNQIQTLNLPGLNDIKPVRRNVNKKLAVISVEISDMQTLKSEDIIKNEETKENKICIIN